MSDAAAHPRTHDDGRNDEPATERLTRRGFLRGAGGMAGGAVLGRRPGAGAPDPDELTDRYLSGMSLHQKVAQRFIFQAQGTVMSPAFQDLLTGIHPGGILFVTPNIGAPEQIRAFVHDIHRSNAFLPPWIAIDQEGGNVIRLAGDPAPGAIDLGRLSNADVRSKSRERAKFLAGYGFDVNFAPVADVAYSAASTMYLRSFGSDPSAVAGKVSAVVKGARSLGIMGAAKHFPGHGRTSIDSHYAVPYVDISYADWRKSDALPFASAVRAGVELVMVGHLQYSQWDSVPMSLSPVAVRTLRKKLGFDGAIVTDDLGMGALAGMDPISVLDRATDAGMDLFLYTMPPLPWDALVAHLVQRIKNGDVSEARNDASVRRILRRKIAHFGLSFEDLGR
jgi:beta-N-acetylhexosaminidase